MSLISDTKKTMDITTRETMNLIIVGIFGFIALYVAGAKVWVALLLGVPPSVGGAAIALWIWKLIIPNVAARQANFQTPLTEHSLYLGGTKSRAIEFPAALSLP